MRSTTRYLLAFGLGLSLSVCGGGGDDDDDDGGACDCDTTADSCNFGCDCDTDCTSCGGTPSCGMHDTDLACGGEPGCTWEAVSCTGSGAACDDYSASNGGSEGACEAQGCSWQVASSSCFGSSYLCSSHTLGECLTYDGCEERFDCTGTPTNITCEELESQATCMDQEGCLWIGF
jgi:hypothetical protein